MVTHNSKSDLPLVVFKQNKEKGTLWIEYPGMWKDELASLLLCSVSMSVLCIKNLDQIPLLLIAGVSCC